MAIDYKIPSDLQYANLRLWRKLIGMKQILVIMAAVVLVGCGKKDSPEPHTKAKGTPKAEVKKPLTEKLKKKMLDKEVPYSKIPEKDLPLYHEAEKAEWKREE